MTGSSPAASSSPPGLPPARSAIIAFGALMVAACAAFLLAAQLKAQPAVLKRMHRLQSFSPNGDGRRDRLPISFRLDKTDDVAVEIVDRDGGAVRRLADKLHAPQGEAVRIAWDGLDDDGARAPDGDYRIRLFLRREGRAVLAPKSFALDTRPPSPAVLLDRDQRTVIAPGEAVKFKVRGVGPKAVPRFRVLRTDVGEARVVRSFEGAKGRRGYTWDARFDDGSAAPPGTYLIAVTSRDSAGNEGTGPPLPPRPGRVDGRPGVTIRGLAVQPPVRPVTAGDLVSFRVDARGRPWSWSVRRVGVREPVNRNRRRKTATTLAFRAPEGASGVYLLEVRSGRYATRVPFAVQATRHAKLTVVLPVITWLGRNPLDEAAKPDGIPNTLENGSVVPFPRPFAGEDGLPAGFADDVAPLLAFLDRNRIRYDLTTDLALSLDDAPRALEGGDGLLFVGAPEWVSRGVARRLRRFAADGGRVAIFGPGALRAGVTVGDGQLTRPTPPGPNDALGARLAVVRKLPVSEVAPAMLSVLEDLQGLGLLEGFSGELGGFSAVEELVSAGQGAEVVAGIGHALTEEEAVAAEEANRTPREERPALSAVRQGRGLVIRVGVEGWVERLEAGDPAVWQLTRNIADLLRGVRPEPHAF